jgi:hypothetical protein
MDFLTPEVLGSAGVGVGTIAVGVFIRFVYRLGGILGGLQRSLDEFLRDHSTTQERHRLHYDREEAHQDRQRQHFVQEEAHQVRVEKLLARPAPRSVTGDTTPIQTPGSAV